MITARLLSVLAASSLAGVAYAQTQTAPPQQPSTAPPAAPAPGYNTSKPSSASSPHQRSATRMRANEAPPNTNPSASAAASPHQHQALRMAENGSERDWSNMPVVSPSGQPLGSVSNAMPGRDGRMSSGYVVVAGANGNGMSTPVPFRTANAMVRDGRLVLSQARLQHAPKVSQEELNAPRGAWRSRADRYWMAHGHMQEKP